MLKNYNGCIEKGMANGNDHLCLYYIQNCMTLDPDQMKTFSPPSIA